MIGQQSRFRAHLRITGRVWCQVCTWNACMQWLYFFFLIAVLVRLRKIMSESLAQSY